MNLNKAYSREGRKSSVLTAFVIQRMNGKEPFMTSYQIAKRLGLSPSQHLRNILNEMVADGILKSTKVQRSGRWDTVIYEIPHRSKRTFPARREIAINQNGKQLGLFEALS